MMCNFYALSNTKDGKKKEKTSSVKITLAFVILPNTNSPMPTTTPSDEVTITVRLPRPLKEALDRHTRGRYATTSEYIRERIRKDCAEEHQQPSPSKTPAA